MLSRLSSLSLAYVLVWFGSLALSVLLIVLLRTRWGESRPLHKCAVLSLLVHLLLAWVAMTLRIIVAGGGTSGPPIRIRIVQDDIEDTSLPFVHSPTESAMDTPPPLLTTNDQALADIPITAKNNAPSPNLEELIAASTEPTTEVTSAEDRPSVAEETNATSSLETEGAATESSFAADPIGSTTSTNQTSETSVHAAQSTQQIPAATEPFTTDSRTTPYSWRTSPNRLTLVEQQGGSGQTEAAVAAALRWLAAAQSPDGRWDANRFGAGQEQAVLGHDRGGAGRNADTGISALALLAFLGAGHSHQFGQYQDTVQRGLDYLLSSQGPDGNLFGDATFYAQMYCHSMATFALAEAQAMTGDARLEPAVARAVSYSLAAQNASTGGWRYRPGDIGDTSQLGWQLMALASAERAGIRVPSHTWLRSRRFLHSVRRGTHGGLASYRPESGPSVSMTAEAFYCRLLLEDVAGVAEDVAADTEATNHLLTTLPESKRMNLYYWYYATLALHHRHRRDQNAEAAWRTWNDRLAATLVEAQITTGPDAGSWDTNTVWGGYGGRVYTTAMAAMCLEVYYRYIPAPRLDERLATPLQPLGIPR